MCIRDSTSGVHDVNYARPLFAFLATIAGAFSCFRIPYQSVVEAAGHFKQTRNGAFVEAGLNIGISIICVIKFGLLGVAFGTLVATIFRSVQYSTYLSRHIIKRSTWIFWKHIAINALIAAATAFVAREFFSFAMPNFFMWAVKSVLVVMCSTCFSLVTSFLF